MCDMTHTCATWLVCVQRDSYVRQNSQVWHDSYVCRDSHVPSLPPLQILRECGDVNSTGPPRENTISGSPANPNMRGTDSFGFPRSLPLPYVSNKNDPQWALSTSHELDESRTIWVGSPCHVFQNAHYWNLYMRHELCESHELSIYIYIYMYIFVTHV